MTSVANPGRKKEQEQEKAGIATYFLRTGTGVGNAV